MIFIHAFFWCKVLVRNLDKSIIYVYPQVGGVFSSLTKNKTINNIKEKYFKGFRTIQAVTIDFHSFQ